MIAISRISLHKPVGENVYTNLHGKKGLNETTGWMLNPSAKSMYEDLFELFRVPDEE